MVTTTTATAAVLLQKLETTHHLQKEILNYSGMFVLQHFLVSMYLLFNPNDLLVMILNCFCMYCKPLSCNVKASDGSLALLRSVLVALLAQSGLL